jgi:integrase
MIRIHDRTEQPTYGQTVPIPWTAFQEELLAVYSPPTVARSTAGRMRAVLRAITALGIESTADLDMVMITRIIAGRPPGESPYTTQSILAVVRAICTYATGSGYTRVNPFSLRKMSRWIRLPKMKDKRCLSREEIRRILDMAARHVAERSGWAQWRARRLLAVIAIVAWTGIRRNECLRLELGDVDLVNRVIWIRPHGHGERLKTSASEQPIPIADALLPYLTDWMSHRLDAPVGYPMPAECRFFIPTLNRKASWTSGQPGGKALDRLKAVALLAGVDGATYQSLRRAWATNAEYFGLGESMIARILRHTTTQTSKKHYRQAEIVNMNASVKDIDF